MKRLDSSLNIEIKKRSENNDWAGLISLFIFFGSDHKELLLKSAQILKSRLEEEYNIVGRWVEEKYSNLLGQIPLTVNWDQVFDETLEKQAVKCLYYYNCFYHCLRAHEIAEESRKMVVENSVSFLEKCYFPNIKSEMNFEIQRSIGFGKTNLGYLSSALSHYAVAEKHLKSHGYEYPVFWQEAGLSKAKANTHLAYFENKAAIPCIERYLHYSQILEKENSSRYWSLVAESHELLCYAYNGIENYEKAVTAGKMCFDTLKKYSSVYLAEQKNYRMFYNYAKACYHSGFENYAINLLQKIFSWRGLEARWVNHAKVLLIEILFKTEQFDKCKPILEESIKYYEGEKSGHKYLVDLYRYYGEILYKINDFNLAQKTFEKSIILFEGNPNTEGYSTMMSYFDSLFKYGFLCFTNQKYVIGFENFKRVIRSMQYYLSEEEILELDSLEVVLSIFIDACDQLMNAGYMHYSVELSDELLEILPSKDLIENDETLMVCSVSYHMNAKYNLLTHRIKKSDLSWMKSFEYSDKIKYETQKIYAIRLRNFILGVSISELSGYPIHIDYCLEQALNLLPKIDLGSCEANVDTKISILLESCEANFRDEKFPLALYKILCVLQEVTILRLESKEYSNHIECYSLMWLSQIYYRLGSVKSSLSCCYKSLNLIRSFDDEEIERRLPMVFAVLDYALSVFSIFIREGYTSFNSEVDYYSEWFLNLKNIDSLNSLFNIDKEKYAVCLFSMRQYSAQSKIYKSLTCGDLRVCEKFLLESLASWENLFSNRLAEFFINHYDSDKKLLKELLVVKSKLNDVGKKKRMAVRWELEQDGMSLSSLPMFNGMKLGKPKVLNKKLEETKQKEILLKYEPLVSQLTEEYNELLLKIKTEEPDFSEYKAFGLEELKEVQNKMSADECFLITMHFRPCFSCIILSKDKIKVHQIGGELYDEIGDYLSEYASFLLRGKEAFTLRSDVNPNKINEFVNLISSSFESVSVVGAKILNEIRIDIPEDAKKIYIYADPGVPCLPFHAMKIFNEELFGQSFDISYIPNLRIWLNIKKPQLVDERSVYVVGAKGETLGFAQIERELVWQKSKIIEQDRKLISLEEILSKSLNANIFHYSGHAIFEGEKPLETALVFNESAKMSVLTCLEELKFNCCELAILSGCETGSFFRTVSFEKYDLLDPVGGLVHEPISLSTAFLIAGAQCTLSTLWPIWDVAACLFIWKFTTCIEEGKSSIVALKKAQTWFRIEIENGEYLKANVIPDIVGSLEHGKSLKVKKSLETYADKFPDSPPFGDPAHWAGYILSGIPG